MARRSADVVCDLLDAIVGGEYAEGRWLPGEAELQLSLGAGRDVVRQGVRALQDRGLIEVLPGRGQRVRQREWWDTRDPDVLRACIERGPEPGILADTIEARTLVERLAARMAIRRAPDADLGLLAARVEAMARAVGDDAAERGGAGDPMAAEEAWFHHMLVLLSGNRQLAKLVEPLHLVLAELRRARAPERDRAALRQHRRILEALSSREDRLVGAAVGGYGGQLAEWLKASR